MKRKELIGKILVIKKMDKKKNYLPQCYFQTDNEGIIDGDGSGLSGLAVQ